MLSEASIGTVQHLRLRNLLLMCCFSVTCTLMLADLLLTGTEAGPDELMQVMLPLIDRETCNQTHMQNWEPGHGTVDDSMVCAGVERDIRGNCYVSVMCIV